MLYRTGLAAGEVIELRQDALDLSPGNESLTVTGTRLTHRTVALDEAALWLLRPWLGIRPRYPDGYLFCIVQGGTRGGRWTKQPYAVN